jgi:hypothetical protein
LQCFLQIDEIFDVIHKVLNEDEDVQRDGLIGVMNEEWYWTVTRSKQPRKSQLDEVYDSKLLFREYLCFGIVVDFVVLRNTGGFSLHRGFRDVGIYIDVKALRSFVHTWRLSIIHCIM